MSKEIRIGVLGAGGLGRNAARFLSMKEGVKLVALCDRKGFAWREEGIRV
jgi:glutamate dehydrogenase/leucine dehydrogenase